MNPARLGQHWLSDKRECERIADLINLKSDETCIEIGGGKGAITKLLAPKCSRLIVYEIDSHWASHLEEHSPKWGGRVEVRNLDALKIEWDRNTLGISNDEKLVIAGNIPYYITSPLFLRIAYSMIDINRAIFLIQKEIAERICAEHGDSEYSRLTVSLGAFVKSEILHEISPDSFTPKPKVMSSVIRMTKLEHPKIESELVDKFEKVVEVGFHMRRKMLKNNLKAGFPNLTSDAINDILEKAGIDAAARAQEVSVENFVKLTWEIDRIEKGK